MAGEGGAAVGRSAPRHAPPAPAAPPQQWDGWDGAHGGVPGVTPPWQHPQELALGRHGAGSGQQDEEQRHAGGFRGGVARK